MTHDLDDLESLDAVTKQKLREQGILTIEELVNMGVRSLISRGFERAYDIVEHTKNYLDDQAGDSFGFSMGDDLIQQFDKRLKLRTGQAGLDEILGGGFSTQKIYEFYGPEGSGKTTLLHQLSCLALKPVEEGGLDSPASIFLDCENTFSKERLQGMAPIHGVDANRLLKSIAWKVIKTSNELLQTCTQVLPKLLERTGARLIMLDSLMTHFRAEYDAVTLRIRQQRANQVIHALKNIAKEHNVLVVLTNQVMGTVNKDGPREKREKYKPSGGFVVGHEIHYRFLIYNVAEYRFIKMVKGVDHPNLQCKLVMSEWGLFEKDVLDVLIKNNDSLMK
ncbi:MAG: ATPase domain-containing protein [Candidatus Helarchaeota archaeon]